MQSIQICLVKCMAIFSQASLLGTPVPYIYPSIFSWTISTTKGHKATWSLSHGTQDTLEGKNLTLIYTEWTIKSYQSAYYACLWIWGELVYLEETAET